MSKSFVKRSMETVGMDGVGSVFAVGTAGVGDGPKYIMGGFIDDIWMPATPAAHSRSRLGGYNEMGPIFVPGGQWTSALGPETYLELLWMTLKGLGACTGELAQSRSRTERDEVGRARSSNKGRYAIA